jgi:hypothetical protein
MKKYEIIIQKLREGGFMSLSLKDRKAVVREEAARYKQLSKKEKGRCTLNEFVNLTGYSRCYAS